MTDRILFSNNGTLEEWTTELVNYKTGEQTFSLVAAEDKIYIGSLFPFNHKYFKFGSTINANASTMIVKYYNGITFVPVADFMDETATGSTSFAKSGFVSWTPDKDEGWALDDTEFITELNSKDIYNLYWLEISFTADLTTSVDISWLGQKFSDDDDLGSEHPTLIRSSMKTAYESGKTDWEEQHVKAAEVLVKDLIEANVIDNRDQILVREKFRLSATSKCAEIAYGGFGDDYIDDKLDARKEYNARRKQRIYMTDKDENALLSRHEARTRGGFLSR